MILGLKLKFKQRRVHQCWADVLVPDPQNTENTESKKVTQWLSTRLIRKSGIHGDAPWKQTTEAYIFAEKATYHKAAPDVQPTADWCTERGHNRRGTSLKYAENRETQHKSWNK